MSFDEVYEQQEQGYENEEREFDHAEQSIDIGNQSDVGENALVGLMKVVREVGPYLHPEEELNDLAAAEAVILARRRQRETVTVGLQNNLRKLTKQYEKASSAAQRPSTHPTPQQHSAELRRLDSEQLTLGKQFNEEQQNVGKKEAELGRWRSDKEEVGRKEVGEDLSTDGGVIRLQLLKQAGFSLIPGKDGVAPKVLLRNDAKLDIHTIPIDKTRSNVHYANLIWGLVGE